MTDAPENGSPRLLPGDPGWVDDGRLWTADELEQLNPTQRAELISQRHQKVLTLDDQDPAAVWSLWAASSCCQSNAERHP